MLSFVYQIFRRFPYAAENFQPAGNRSICRPGGLGRQKEGIRQLTALQFPIQGWYNKERQKKGVSLRPEGGQPRRRGKAVNKTGLLF